MIWALVGIVAFWYALMACFVAIMHAKHVMRDDVLTLFWKVCLWPLAVLGLLLDFAFNVVFGTLMFVELPRELLFTSRVTRHWRGSPAWRFKIADFWRRQLNQMDPGHVK